VGKAYKLGRAEIVRLERVNAELKQQLDQHDSDALTENVLAATADRYGSGLRLQRPDVDSNLHGLVAALRSLSEPLVLDMKRYAAFAFLREFSTVPHPALVTDQDIKDHLARPRPIFHLLETLLSFDIKPDDGTALEPLASAG
jgi:hypothetical protein